jgi:hypothetical protein
MPFDAVTLANVEEALTEVFNYHDQLDNFLIRAGVQRTHLDQVRSQAEQRAKQSARVYQRAPKRFVAQELVNILSGQGAEGDRVMADIVSSLVRGTFPEASPNGTAAVERLKAQSTSDRAEKESRRAAEAAAVQAQERAAERVREEDYRQTQKNRDLLHDRFTGLMAEANAHSRGYLFESFLGELFALEKLAPRAAFKILGEQIDGTFAWRNRTYLVEAKWTKEPVAGAEFGAFAYKIDGKTADTRGVFISVNGYSPQAILGLNHKGALKFVCLDGAHIVRSLMPGQSLSKILTDVWRHADETGEAYLDAGRLGV